MIEVKIQQTNLEEDEFQLSLKIANALKNAGVHGSVMRYIIQFPSGKPAGFLSGELF